MKSKKNNRLSTTFDSSTQIFDSKDTLMGSEELDELKKTLDQIIPQKTIPVDVRLITPFPVPISKCIGNYVRGVGFLFSVNEGQGIRRKLISEFTKNSQFDRERDDAVIFLLFGKSTVDIFVHGETNPVPLKELSFQQILSFTRNQALPHKKVSADEGQGMPDLPKNSEGQLRVPNLDDIRPEDIARLSAFSNELIHSAPSELFNKNTWRKIGSAVTRILPEIFRARDQKNREMSLELIARSVPLMSENEKLDVIAQLFKLLSADDHLPMNQVDKVSSIILVLSSSVDPTRTKEIARTVLNRFDRNLPMPSNLAKLIRKFL